MPEHESSSAPLREIREGCTGTVWLYGDFYQHPGLLGFLYSARKEHKGDCVRAVIGWDQPNINFRKAVDSIAPLDMILSVFKQGKLGIYAPVELSESEVRHHNAQCL